MARSSINKRAIAQLTKDIEREFDKHPIRVPIEVKNSVHLLSSPPPTTINNYHAPVINVTGDSAQLAWANETVNQTQRNKQIVPGFEAIAQAVASTLQALPQIGLADDELQDATDAANEVLAEITSGAPDQGPDSPRACGSARLSRAGCRRPEDRNGGRIGRVGADGD